MYKSNGQLVDDYREAYWWLRDNTPEDARVMAWWDYGYQISGIAERTTIADGNTWNQDHIGMLGLCLTSPVPEAHTIARHLADYILIWTGGGGDDLGKSTHMARISNSVFQGHCAYADCSTYGTGRTGPTKMMSESLMWHLSGRDSANGLPLDSVFPALFSAPEMVELICTPSVHLEGGVHEHVGCPP
jgi:dolichyl-diphosphooligosaccharide---protein glycosyltransferase